MQMKSAKKFLSGLSAAAIMATLLVGAFSYFTDYQTKELSARAGTLTMTMTDATASLVNDGDVLNPGDVIPVTFKANNTGEKSMDVKAVITVSADKAMTKTDHQYKLTNGTSELTGTLSSDQKSIVYTIDDVTLSGSVEEDGTSTSNVYSYQFEMDADADNTWQNTTANVKIELYAKQHRNTDSLGTDWTSIVETE